MIFSGIVINHDLLIFMILATLWSLPWKGYALWKAANKRDKFWFVALLVVNTLAILEILYIFFLSRDKKEFFTGGDNIKNDVQN